MSFERELSELLQVIQKKSNAKIRTAIPATVLSFDADTQTATVQPTVQSAYYDTDEEEIVQYTPAPVANCPVYYPSGGGFSITFPIEAGDECLILCAERSIDEWMATGNESAPRDLRRFDLSDAMVFPGLKPRANPLSDFNGDDLEIRSRDGTGAVLRINSNGEIYLGNSTTDLLTVLNDLMTQVATLAASTVVTLAGPQPLSAGAGVITAINSTLKPNLATIKE